MQITIKMKLFLCLFALYVGGFAQNWVENKEYEYYYDGSDDGIVYSYDDAVSKCAEQQAILVMIKTKEVQDFIATQGWASKYKML